MQQKKTIEEIKEIYPGLEMRAWEEGLDVGYPEPGDLFNVQGTGDTIEEAWQDAYECLTNTGRYSKQINEKVLCKISIDKNVDGTYYLYIHDDKSEVTLACVPIPENSGLEIAYNTKLHMGEFPF